MSAMNLVALPIAMILCFSCLALGHERRLLLPPPEMGSEDIDQYCSMTQKATNVNCVAAGKAACCGMNPKHGAMSMDGGATCTCIPPSGKMIIRPSVEQFQNNETNETEFDVLYLPTPPPTKPTTGLNVIATISSAADETPDQGALQRAMQATLLAQGTTVDLDDIKTEIEYKVEQEFSFPAGVVVTEDIATTAVANTFSVPKENVIVTIVSSRRLQAAPQLGRRLSGTQVNAVITVDDATTADAVKATGTDTGAVAAALTTNYIEAHQALTGETIASFVVTAAAPALTMDISYEIKSDTAAVIEVPPVNDLITKLADEGITVPITVETPTPTAAPTLLPPGLTFSPTVPTAQPTAMPTKMPTATPTKVPTATPTKMPTATPTKASTDVTANTTTTAGIIATESGAPSSYRLGTLAFACAIAVAWAQ